MAQYIDRDDWNYIVLIFRRYDKMKQQLDDIYNSSHAPPDNSRVQSGLGDTTATKGQRAAKLSVEIEAVDRIYSQYGEIKQNIIKLKLKDKMTYWNIYTYYNRAPSVRSMKYVVKEFVERLGIELGVL